MQRMSSPGLSFSAWLSGQLVELQADESVFLPYILSILETGEAGEREEGRANKKQTKIQELHSLVQRIP